MDSSPPDLVKAQLEQLQIEVHRLRHALNLQGQFVQNAIVAIQETLGIMPQGDCQTVRERLERLEAFPTFPQHDSPSAETPGPQVFQSAPDRLHRDRSSGKR